MVGLNSTEVKRQARRNNIPSVDEHFKEFLPFLNGMISELNSIHDCKLPQHQSQLYIFIQFTNLILRFITTLTVLTSDLFEEKTIIRKTFWSQHEETSQLALNYRKSTTSISHQKIFPIIVQAFLIISIISTASVKISNLSLIAIQTIECVMKSL